MPLPQQASVLLLTLACSFFIAAECRSQEDANTADSRVSQLIDALQQFSCDTEGVPLDFQCHVAFSDPTSIANGLASRLVVERAGDSNALLATTLTGFPLTMVQDDTIYGTAEDRLGYYLYPEAHSAASIGLNQDKAGNNTAGIQYNVDDGEPGLRLRLRLREIYDQFLENGETKVTESKWHKMVTLRNKRGSQLSVIIRNGVAGVDSLSLNMRGFSGLCFHVYAVSTIRKPSFSLLDPDLATNVPLLSITKIVPIIPTRKLLNVGDAKRGFGSLPTEKHELRSNLLYLTIVGASDKTAVDVAPRHKSAELLKELAAKSDDEKSQHIASIATTLDAMISSDESDPSVRLLHAERYLGPLVCRDLVAAMQAVLKDQSKPKELRIAALDMICRIGWLSCYDSDHLEKYREFATDLSDANSANISKIDWKLVEHR